jgi:ABC-type transport system substrate-binding protein
MVPEPKRGKQQMIPTKKRSTRMLPAVVLALALIATACGSDGGSADAPTPATDAPPTATDAPTAPPADSTDDEAPPATDAPTAPPAAPVVVEGEPLGVLVVGQNFFPNQQASLDPRIMSTSTNGEFLDEIYATLVRVDHRTGAFEPYLAESFDVVDSQTVTITIRSDANFHDGSPVTSADAKASIEATKANTEEGTCNCNRGIAIVETIEVVDDKTFTINLSKPGVATVFELMTGPEFMVSPAGAGASQATAPIGNGPMKFVELIEGQRITLEKWADFFGADDVTIGGLEFVNLEEGTTQLNALLAGDIDMAMELDFSTFESADERDGFTAAAVQNDTTFLWFTACQADGSEYEDIRVRQGIMHSLDRNLINEALFGGLGTPSVGLFPPGHPYNDPTLEDIYPYDLDKARALFEEAGVAGMTLGVWATASIPESIDMILVMNQATSEAGLTLEPLPTDDLVGDYLQEASLDDPPYDLDHNGVLISQSRPGMQKLTRLFNPGQITNPCSKPSQGPEYDRAQVIVDELFGLAPDDPKAIDLWKEIQRFNVEQARHMIIVYKPSYTAWSDSVSGVDPDSFGAAINGGYSFSSMAKTN